MPARDQAVALFLIIIQNLKVLLCFFTLLKLFAIIDIILIKTLQIVQSITNNIKITAIVTNNEC